MKYDIIIVGAGLAGVSTALHLLQKSGDYKYKILILEASEHPREKLCGGGVLQDGEYILNRLGLSVDDVTRTRVEEVNFTYQGKGITFKREPESFNVIRRTEFDSHLADVAKERGIEIKENIKVLKVTNTYDEVKVSTDCGDYYGNVVVGSDGSNSVVRKAVVDGKKEKPAMALEVYVCGEDSPNYSPMRKDCAEFDFSNISNGLHGYTWDFPMIDGDETARNRGIYCSKVYKSAMPNSKLRNLLSDKFKEDKIDLDNHKLQGFPIRCFSTKGTFSSNRILLVGDAAGVDPIYGEGISFALGYGEIAADEIDGAFESKNFTFKRYKKNLLRHPMGKCLKLRVTVAKLLYGFRADWMQKFIWWNLGSVLKWFVEKYIIDWAKDKR